MPEHTRPNPKVDGSETAGSPEPRRIELLMKKPWFALYAGVRPTLVLAGRGQPTQWGLGTWQVPSDRPVTIEVFLFNRMWRFGQATFSFEASTTPSLEYRAPALPFLPGRLRAKPGHGALRGQASS